MSINVARTTKVRVQKGLGRPWLWLIALILLTWPAVGWLAARVLIVRSGDAPVDAIAVLAGSSTYIERARHAANLFKEGRAPLIVLTNDGQQSGWSLLEQRNLFFFEREVTELEKYGVPRERITVIAQPVFSTYDEAVTLRAFAARNNLRSMLVVAGPYQTRRALRTLRGVFEGTGVSVGVDAPAPGEQSPSPSTWWWHRLGWKVVVGEYVKLVYYSLAY